MIEVIHELQTKYLDGNTSQFDKPYEVLNAPMGTGKTTLLEKKAWDDKIATIIHEPMVSIVLQKAEKHKHHGVYAGIEPIETICQYATFDSHFKFDYTGKRVVIDEIHELITSASYRKAMPDFYEHVMIEAEQVIFMSGTLLPTMKSPQSMFATTPCITVVQSEAEKRPYKTLRVKDRKKAVLNLIKRNTDCLTVIELDDKSQGKEWCQLINTLFHVNFVALSSDTKDQPDSPEYKVYEYILENRKIPEDIDGIITTRFFSMGIDVDDEDREVLYIFPRMTEPYIVSQTVNRFRQGNTRDIIRMLSYDFTSKPFHFDVERSFEKFRKLAQEFCRFLNLLEHEYYTSDETLQFFESFGKTQHIMEAIRKKDGFWEVNEFGIEYVVYLDYWKALQGNDFEYQKALIEYGLVEEEAKEESTESTQAERQASQEIQADIQQQKEIIFQSELNELEQEDDETLLNESSLNSKVKQHVQKLIRWTNKDYAFKLLHVIGCSTTKFHTLCCQCLILRVLLQARTYPNDFIKAMYRMFKCDGKLYSTEQILIKFNTLLAHHPQLKAFLDPYISRSICGVDMNRMIRILKWFFEIERSNNKYRFVSINPFLKYGEAFSTIFADLKQDVIVLKPMETLNAINDDWWTPDDGIAGIDNNLYEGKISHKTLLTA